jgi:hypothetical protein
VRGFAGRFEDGAKQPLVELALEAVRLAGGRAEEWLDRVSSIDAAAVAGAVAGIPGMSEVRSTFLCTLLETNGRRLIS